MFCMNGEQGILDMNQIDAKGAIHHLSEFHNYLWLSFVTIYSV